LSRKATVGESYVNLVAAGASVSFAKKRKRVGVFETDRMRRAGRVTALILGAAILAAGCRKEPLRPDAISPGRVTGVRTQPERRIERLYPAETRAGVPFNLQPGGSSAIAVAGTGFRRSDVIHWNGKPLATVFGSPALLTAEVPAALLGTPATVTVEVRSAGAAEVPAGSAVFRVLP
jgi:hypothetical protein